MLPDAARDLRDIRPSQQRIAQSREGHAGIGGAAVGSASAAHVLAERALTIVVGVGSQHSFDDSIYAGLRLQRCEARCLGHNKRWPARSDERQTAGAIRELHVELRAEPVDHSSRGTGAGDHFCAALMQQRCRHRWQRVCAGFFVGASCARDAAQLRHAPTTQISQRFGCCADGWGFLRVC